MMLWTCRDAIQNLRAHRARSLLAVLGVWIGTASVVALLSIGRLATEHALAEFKALGTHFLAATVLLKDHDSHHLDQHLNELITMANANAYGFESVSPYVVLSQETTEQGATVGQSVVGVTEAFFDTLTLHAEQGRLLSPIESGASVCMLGKQAAKRLHDAGVFVPVGHDLRLGHGYCSVVGTLAHTPSRFFVYNDLNEAVVVPLRAMPQLTTQLQAVYLIVQLPEQADMADAKAQVEQMVFAWLKHRARIYFASPEQLIHSRQQQQHTLQMMLAIMAAITLVVGGVGVMNMMLVSVIERQQEMGLRLAVGALPQDICRLFLCEAIFLSMAGGVLGVLSGVAFAAVVALLEKWTFYWMMVPPVVGFAVSAWVGAFFGFYPAYRASKVQPVEALRA